MKCWQPTAIIALLCGSVPAVAVDISGRIGVGVIDSDNVTRVNVDKVKDTIVDASADFMLHEESRRINADLAGNLQFLDYTKGTYSNKVVGDVSGYGRFSVVPDRFDWEVQDNFGQQRLNPGTPQSPENQQNVNFFSTGPRLSVNLAQQLKLGVGARYSKVSYETTDDNNDRTGGSLSLTRTLDSSSAASLNATTESVRYDNNLLNPDFRRRQAFARYQSLTARAKIVADAGYDDLSGDAGKLGTVVLRLELSRFVSASSTISLFAGKEGSDSGSLLKQLQSQVPQLQGANSVQRSTDPFSNQYVRAAWSFSRNRTGLDLNISRSKETHESQTTLDHTSTGFYAGVQRRISRVLTASLSGSYFKSEYDVDSASSRQSFGSAGISWRATRLLDVKLEYQYMHQTSPVFTNRYTENRIGLSVGANWDPRPIARRVR